MYRVHTLLRRLPPVRGLTLRVLTGSYHPSTRLQRLIFRALTGYTI